MTERAYRRRVTFQHTIEYDVVSSSHIFRPDNQQLLSGGKTETGRRFVVVDANVERHYSTEIRRYFLENGVDARICVFPAGEENKTVESFIDIARQLDGFPIDRRDEPIIAIGGGVLTDVVGFVAASYRRGVPHIKVPTTLMGYVDASVGIKTGVNFDGNKNRIGAFAAPIKVILDKVFLTTLPDRHILNGVCEIVKLAVIRDAELFRLLEDTGARSIQTRFQDEHGEAILDRSITGMLDELSSNLFEEDLARRVDFGHTFSYGLETRHGVDLLHGEAVLLDILVSTLIAVGRHILSASDGDRVFDLVTKLGLPLRTGLLEEDLLLRALEERTWHRNGLQRVPLPEGIGGCRFVNDIDAEEIAAAVDAARRLG